MDNIPMYLSFVMITLSPFLIAFKSKKLNLIINIAIYLIKFFIPFILIYYAINIILVPFTYFKILYCIIRNKYQT